MTLFYYYRTNFYNALETINYDPLAGNLTSISPYAYCAGDPVNLTDPTGMSPVYNRKGEYLGCTEEGFTGDILLYYGAEGETGKNSGA